MDNRGQLAFVVCFSDSFIWREQARLWGGRPTGGCRWRQHIERGSEGNKKIFLFCCLYVQVLITWWSLFSLRCLYTPPSLPPPPPKKIIPASTHTKTTHNNNQSNERKVNYLMQMHFLYNQYFYVWGKGKRVFAEIHSNYCTKIDSSHTLVWDG